MSNPEAPNFGVLLAPALGALPEPMRPAILCGLERAAARRYRAWAVEFREHSPVLLACAAREDEIADSVEGLFPIDAAGQEAIEKALPKAIAIYNEVFDPHPALDQLYLQSEAELQGAAAWVSIAEGVEGDAAKKILARCTELERESSGAVKEILAAIG